MPGKNVKLRAEVSSWMQDRVKQCHNADKLARLAAANFNITYEPAWLLKEAQRLTAGVR